MTLDDVLAQISSDYDYAAEQLEPLRQGLLSFGDNAASEAQSFADWYSEYARTQNNNRLPDVASAALRLAGATPASKLAVSALEAANNARDIYNAWQDYQMYRSGSP